MARLRKQKKDSGFLEAGGDAALVLEKAKHAFDAIPIAGESLGARATCSWSAVSMALPASSWRGSFMPLKSLARRTHSTGSR
jgi:3-oxoacyl-(acyl-carrier-protein) synthase